MTHISHDWIEFEFAIEDETYNCDWEGTAHIRIYSHSEPDWLIEAIDIDQYDGSTQRLDPRGTTYSLIRDALEAKREDEINRSVLMRGVEAAA